VLKPIHLVWRLCCFSGSSSSLALRSHSDVSVSPPSRFAEEVIPLALVGRNILARAKNGTGKTGSFCIPCLEKVDTTKKKIQALVLVPTRELALQTAAVLKDLGKFLEPPLEVMSLTGGTSLRDDILRLNGTVHVLVGTPGRVLDLASKGAANLREAKYIALVSKRRN
jgi:ATP-dependent RNA helicase DDX6/DHH1